MKLAAGEEEAEARDLSLALVRGKGAATATWERARAAREGLAAPGSLGTKGQRLTDKWGFTPGDGCFRTVIVTSCRHEIQDGMNCSEERHC